MSDSKDPPDKPEVPPGFKIVPIRDRNGKPTPKAVPPPGQSSAENPATGIHTGEIDEKRQREVARKARAHASKAMDTLAALMEGAADERVRFQAAKLILDIGYGRPATQQQPKEQPDPIKMLPGDDKL